MKCTLCNDGKLIASLTKKIMLLEKENVKLRAALELVADIEENELISYEKHGLTCHNDILKKYKDALDSKKV